jgi:hypothetical protein
MALVARRMPQFFQIATEAVAENNTAVVFVHQMRSVLEMYSSELETYNGGNALKHSVSMVLNLRRASTSQDVDKGERFKGTDGEKLGHMTNFKCIKGGVGTIKEGESIQLDFFKGQGFTEDSSIVHFAARNKILLKDGPGNYTFTDSIGTYSQRGIGNVIDDMSKPELKQRLLNECKNQIQLKKNSAQELTPDEEFEKEMIKGVENDQTQTNTEKE